MDTERARDGAVLLVCDSRGRVLCRRCLVAAAPLSRMRGLLGRRSLSAGEGLLLRPAAAIHTAFMRFAIDAVFLDREGVVLRVAHDLAPWRTAGKRGARTVLELAAGRARNHGLEPGEKLIFAAENELTAVDLELDRPCGNAVESQPANRLPAFR